jgi:hypothetical protein
VSKWRGCHAFGVAVAAAIFSAAGGYGSPSFFVDGFVPGLWAAAGLTAAGVAAAALLPARRSANSRDSSASALDASLPQQGLPSPRERVTSAS